MWCAYHNKMQKPMRFYKLIMQKKTEFAAEISVLKIGRFFTFSLTILPQSDLCEGGPWSSERSASQQWQLDELSAWDMEKRTIVVPFAHLLNIYLVSYRRAKVCFSFFICFHFILYYLTTARQPRQYVETTLQVAVQKNTTK